VCGENYSAQDCTMKVTLVPGDYDTFLQEMNNVTKGEFTFNVVGQESASEEDSGNKGKRGKGRGRGRGGKRKGR